MTTRQQFMQRPKIKNLPPQEKERRYKQHLMSLGGIEQIRGRGNYFTKALRSFDDNVLKKIPRGTFARVGSYIAGKPGQAAGDLISQLSGRGDYTIQKNSILQGVDAQNGAGNISFAQSGAARIRVEKREFIMNVVAPTEPSEFNQVQLRLQCTNSTTFPWLAGIAKHFTEWELHGCVFTYESTSSNFASNMALGTLAMSCQYNANENPYVNMEQILSAAYNSRCNPSESMMHGIECDPALQASEHLLTRRVGTSGPPNLYDHGVLTVATEGLPAAPGTVLGRIFVNYDIELNIPVLPSEDTFSGDSLCVNQSTFSSEEPPLGSRASLPVYGDPYNTGLVFSQNPGKDVNVLYESESLGPRSKPMLPADETANLIAWMSDRVSTTPGVSSGEQFLSFAMAGVYVLELHVLVSNSLPSLPSDLFTCTTFSSQGCEVMDDSYAVQAKNPYSLGFDAVVHRWKLVCTQPDATFVLTRTATGWNTQTFTSLTMCAHNHQSLD